MVIVVSLFLALAAMTFSYAIGQGGPVAGLVFFTVLFAGGLLRALQPLLDKLRA
jgi:hypothetical protein